MFSSILRTISKNAVSLAAIVGIIGAMVLQPAAPILVSVIVVCNGILALELCSRK